MVTRAVLRYVRISPRKVRPVIPLVKGKGPEEAVAILYSVKKKASEYLIALLRSAMANAKRMQGVEISDLYVSNIIVSGGPQMKRFRAGSMGRASTIRKRTSHITVELDHRAPKAADTAAVKGEHHGAAVNPKAHVKSRHAEAPAAKKAKGKAAVRPESGKKGKE